MNSFQEIINNHFPQLLLGLFGSLITLSVAWQKGYFHFPNPKPDIKLSSKAFFGCLFLFFIVLVWIVPLVSTLWFSLLAGHFVDLSTFELSLFSQTLLNLFAIIAIAIAMALYYWFCSAQTRQAVWRASPAGQTVHNILMGVVTWFISFPLVILTSQIIEVLSESMFHFTHRDQQAVYFLKSIKEYPLYFTLMALLIAFVVPFVEELIFRGFIQTWLLGKFQKRGVAIGITSMIFALCHYSASQGLDNIELLCSLFVFSCFLGFIYERQQSLWASIALHSTFNTLSILAIL